MTVKPTIIQEIDAPKVALAAQMRIEAPEILSLRPYQKRGKSNNNFDSAVSKQFK
ncbi:MAG: hypothetical protein ACHQUC_08565 [Chlamydiales bacterium]